MFPVPLFEERDMESQRKSRFSIVRLEERIAPSAWRWFGDHGDHDRGDHDRGDHDRGDHDHGDHGHHHW
jgi:hypothetical protein